MRFLRHISIKNSLMGAVGVLVLALTALSVNNVLNTYGETREISRIDTANELADMIIEATCYEAKERGITAITLSSDVPADGETIKKGQDKQPDKDIPFKGAVHGLGARSRKEDRRQGA